MDKTWLFYLNNSNTPLADDPIGWEDQNRKLIRNEKYNGLFVEYFVDVIFQGDGYTLLKNLIDTTGYCQDVPIKIVRKCYDINGTKPYTVYFEGIIKLKTFEEDIENCTIKADIEDNTLSKLFIDRANTVARFDFTKSISGSFNLSNILKTFDISNDSFPQSHVSRDGYLTAEAFQFILDYITDGQIQFVSDYFTVVSNPLDPTARVAQSILFTSPLIDLVAPGNTTIETLNYFGQTETYIITNQLTVAGTLDEITFALNNDTSADPIRQKFYRQDYAKHAKVTNNGTDTIEMLSDLPVWITNVQGAAAVITNGTPKITAFEDDMAYSFFMTGGQLRNATGPIIPELSFDDLFLEMKKHANLGISITRVNGVPTMRIEKISYFFQTTNANGFRLTNVRNIKRKVSDQFNLDILTVGDGGDKKGYIAGQTWKTDWTVSDFCTSDKQDTSLKFIVDFDNIQRQLVNTDDNQDEKIYFMEGINPSVGVYQTKAYEYLIYQSNALAVTVAQCWAMNVHLTNYWKITNWLFSVQGLNIVNADRIITKDTSLFYDANTIDIKYEYELEYDLNPSEEDSIFVNLFDYITFNYQDENIISYDKKGWVMEVSTVASTGKTIFKLIAQD